MRDFGWLKRLQYGAIAGFAGWLSGVVMTIPIELTVARRYIEGTRLALAQVLTEGMIVWSIFALLLALAVWLPVVLPCVLLLPPRWVVPLRWLIIPGTGVLSVYLVGKRLRSFQNGNYRHLDWYRTTFLTSLNVFALVFTVVTAGVYLYLARRRLQASD